ncbi:hypothetical protein PY257_16365 [Ramlibacter sp. H39-3-26]|uniref:hypothetical protein n=1 Tax=Curvibacter soli TaxID=3031331 RepID=UPI0023DB1BE6|nr:hypothetical protein [Ramlibacter sp. H39-3-26]MDF1486724.1 hypothetical protein [Ramlibacter sp. H39-3-26]
MNSLRDTFGNPRAKGQVENQRRSLRDTFGNARKDAGYLMPLQRLHANRCELCAAYRMPQRDYEPAHCSAYGFIVHPQAICNGYKAQS